MTDDLDPADWLASQFGEEEPEKAPRRRGMSARQPSSRRATPPDPAPADPTPTERYTPPAAAPAPAPAPASGGGFSWGLTPGGGAAEPPVTPASPATPAADPFAGLFAETPAPPAWDVPTVATPVVPEPTPPRDPAPTVAFGTDLARQEFPGFGAPLDPALDGATEVLGAHLVGLETPRDEGVEVSAIDSLFGDSAFVEYEDALIPALPPRPSGGELVVVDRPTIAADRAPLSQVQKVLMSVVGGLVAVLLLIVLFLAGQRIAASRPAPAVADPTPSASTAPTVGPLPPGQYAWDRLLGGECLSTFTSPWEDTFTVVSCTQPHPAQLVLKGTFPDTVDSDYPGVDALQKLAASLCVAPTVIDYAATDGATDIQILASFAPDEKEWGDGNRTFYCFANRTGGAEFSRSIAVPQTTATPSATPTP